MGIRRRSRPKGERQRGAYRNSYFQACRKACFEDQRPTWRQRDTFAPTLEAYEERRRLVAQAIELDESTALF